ncbi:MAG: enoyl-CoA hydratase/isomerase family protein [Chloroflexi bacterium]|nr:enoyl-CoA hydratase/isomerase family protein [Chloroflexota bacterium]MCY3589194.1 enoyl-CoA hydratase/isomerase family protein [Chloroflexota bacterium]MCY3687327.1 enoyl-CoA hydratase/isomerase family protein [Chloroflexota bacterium]MDE2709560.1 enoyl-CoA hydratase/isomerase family protein [Chloroflexota bacterium]MYD72862.1 enoyl-CoA hydratase/isomerase family protein [Chloroflexota bacterium]
MSTVHSELIVEDGPVTRLTINRPERHNAINTEVGDAIVDVVNRVGRDPSVYVLVLAGEGRSFCSGDDVSEGAEGSISDYPWQNPYHALHIAPFNLERHPYFRLQSLLRRIPQMVIAQVQGYCMGSGFDLMLASDYAIADPDAKLRFVIPATAFLPKYVGLKQATRLILDDQFISGTEAAELGLVTRVAEPGRLREEVDELANRLAAIGRERHGYLGVVKEAINRSLWPHLDDDLRMQLISHRMSDLYRQHAYKPNLD